MTDGYNPTPTELPLPGQQGSNNTNALQAALINALSKSSQPQNQQNQNMRSPLAPIASLADTAANQLNKYQNAPTPTAQVGLDAANAKFGTFDPNSMGNNGIINSSGDLVDPSTGEILPG